MLTTECRLHCGPDSTWNSYPNTSPIILGGSYIFLLREKGPPREGAGVWKFYVAIHGQRRKTALSFLVTRTYFWRHKHDRIPLSMLSSSILFYSPLYFCFLPLGTTTGIPLLHNFSYGRPGYRPLLSRSSSEVAGDMETNKYIISFFRY